MTITYESKINTFIKNQPFIQVRFKGSDINVKWLEGAHIIVKVTQNLYNKGFYNGDICEVLAELENGNLWIKRLKDNHQDIIEKIHLKRATWEKYDF